MADKSLSVGGAWIVIDLVSTAQVLLRRADYHVRLSSLRDSPMICFEDQALLGFCCAFPSAGELIRNWKSYETEILIRFAPNFRAAGDKAWNVYSIFLCDNVATDIERREITWVEEDLERTRKIAAAGIANREDLARVLLPILPIQYQPRLLEGDAVERLHKRLRDISEKAAAVALDDQTPAAEVVRLLGERS
ncbi:hypothetical protein IFT59_07160 [Rhizobium sp. CFBP 8752]|uniref:hypothetical protein n=1 Tax=Rhizobium sp. CFBP 8752 TaxID=2775301 RepID=UPI0017845352|nr:hypothetical protein [Rhizobium sp. CFBP 8752]MBD8663030.1 hypothetical protein [Rhizobium sp. CFBP 8752]